MLFQNALCTGLLTYKYMTELMLHISVKSIRNDDPHSCIQGVHVYTHFSF